jgi:hypothetical protein
MRSPWGATGGGYVLSGGHDLCQDSRLTGEAYVLTLERVMNYTQ